MFAADILGILRAGDRPLFAARIATTLSSSATASWRAKGSRSDERIADLALMRSKAAAAPQSMVLGARTLDTRPHGRLQT